MDTLVVHRFFEGLVDHPMLLEQSFTLERRRDDDHLPMVTATSQVLRFNRGPRKRLCQCLFNFLWANHAKNLTALGGSFQASRLHVFHSGFACGSKSARTFFIIARRSMRNPSNVGRPTYQ